MCQCLERTNNLSRLLPVRLLVSGRIAAMPIAAPLGQFLRKTNVVSQAGSSGRAYSAGFASSEIDDPRFAKSATTSPRTKLDPGESDAGTGRHGMTIGHMASSG